MYSLMPENLKFSVFLPFLANHLEAIFVFPYITVESTEGVATIKHSGKEQKTVPDVLMHPKTKKQLNMEKGSITSLWTCLFSQASVKWELT